MIAVCRRMVGIRDPSKLHHRAGKVIDASWQKELTPSETDGSVEHRKETSDCADYTLQEMAMTTAELAELAFSFKETPINSKSEAKILESALIPVSDAMPVSSSSSTCTRESDFSESETLRNESTVLPAYLPISNMATSETLQLHCELADRLNEKVSRQTTSRQGRSSQRWLANPESNSDESIRLVSGCVPILRNGKILFVSASRKPEWILPKGGWELDEEVEESAIRESYEEAGVLGILGPKLNVVQYETRKARKRRLEREELERQKKLSKSAFQSSLCGQGSISDISSSHITEALPDGGSAPVSSREDSILISEIDPAALEPFHLEDTLSAVSTPTPAKYSQVRMTMFPLYISKVLDDWPESGRLRRAVDIDDAITMMEKRPEFKSMLQEVKERGLHLCEPQHFFTSKSGVS